MTAGSGRGQLKYTEERWKEIYERWEKEPETFPLILHTKEKTLVAAQMLRNELNAYRVITRHESRFNYPKGHNDYGRCIYDDFMLQLRRIHKKEHVLVVRMRIDRVARISSIKELEELDE